MLAVLDTLAIESAILVGASDGGRQVLDFALEHPARVAGIMICDTAVADLPDPSPDEQAALEDLLAALEQRQQALDRGDVPAAVAVDLAVFGRARPEGPRESGADLRRQLSPHAGLAG